MDQNQKDQNNIKKKKGHILKFKICNLGRQEGIKRENGVKKKMSMKCKPNLNGELKRGWARKGRGRRMCREERNIGL